MHKRIVNEAIIELTISPAGPVLIKAGEQGADPTKPDMEFVETYHAGGRSVYLPGSSLKGALRAQCERIVRTVGGSRPHEGRIWACNPLDEKEPCRKLRKDNGDHTAAIYQKSCTVCRLFGSTDIAAHARIADAYPVDATALRLEERNGVAIDRVFGSVAVGPFNYQVLTAGSFKTRITVKNFTTPQLALLALAIRDFAEQRVGIGFAKSRGMGQVDMRVERVEIRYPSAVSVDGQLVTLGGQQRQFANNVLMGAGELVDAHEGYGFPTPDQVTVSVNAQADIYGFGATLNFSAPKEITALWRGCVASWRRLVQGG